MRKFLWASDTLSYVAGAEFSGGAAFVGFVNQYQQCDSVRLFSIDQFGACNFKILDLKMLSDSSWIVLGFVDYCSPSFNSKYIIMHADHSFNPIKAVYLNDNYLLVNY